MTELSRLITPDGRMADPFSSRGLAYRAFRLGHAPAAYNLAMSYFNARDLQEYRRWIRRAADLGDADATEQLKRFEVRMPHGAARNIRRVRPPRAYD